MKKLQALLTAVVVLGIGGTAYADLCKSPKVTVFNNRTDNTIDVKKIEYFDGCDNKWRTEDVKNTEIEIGKSKTFTDDLEHVGNCKITKFKLYRAVRQSAGGAYGAYSWGAELVPDQGTSQKCNSGVQYTIHAHD